MKTQLINILNTLNLESGGKLITKDIADYVDKIMNKAKIIIHAEQNQIIGFVAYYDNDDLEENAYLSMLAISPKHQKKGLGSELMSYTIRNLNDKGFASYSLEVNEWNEKAINFYKKFEFRTVKVEEGIVYMTKTLNNAG